jgi:hypothetical protein
MMLERDTSSTTRKTRDQSKKSRFQHRYLQPNFTTIKKSSKADINFPGQTRHQ